ncbi:MAG: lysC [Chlamydiales bacterium]|jgi:aspartate kinase|nr:lysC [Chlamydiales bacterium]
MPKSLVDDQTLVMKFGGASVRTPQHFSLIADLIVERKKSFPRLVVCVSAMGNTTNSLISLAKEVHPEPPRRELDMLVSVGERISISLLAMALASKGEEAVSFTGSQSGIITDEEHWDAKIIDVRPIRPLQVLEEGKIAIVAGFQGVSRTKEITTLGRGGSDTTAVALGIALRAQQIEFYKDVAGIFERDPKVFQEAMSFSHLNYDEALSIVESGAKVLSKRCLNLAKLNGIPLYISSFLPEEKGGTYVYDPRISRQPRGFYEENACSPLNLFAP